MAYRINITQIKEKIGSAQKTIDSAFAKGVVVLEDKKKELLQNLDNHVVTREIREGLAKGVDGKNLSGTLNGKGNLFGFIGFVKSEGDPIKVLENLIKREVRLKKSSSGAQYNKNSNKYQFTVYTPSSVEVEAETPMPWGGGSWVRGLERGISGLKSFMYWKEIINARSRSQAGLQSKITLRSTEFRKIDYFSKLMKEFKDKLN